jgi:hypothetical protein
MTSLLLHSMMGTIGEVASTIKWPRTASRNEAMMAWTSRTWHRATDTEAHPTTATVSPATMAHRPMSLLPCEAGSTATHTVGTVSAVAGATRSRARWISDACSSFSGRYALNCVFITP